MTRIESIIALLKANTGAATVAPTSVATYANLANTITLETISSGIMATSPLKGAFDGLPKADLLDQMFILLFGYTQAEMDALKATEAGAAGYQYWMNELENNSNLINVNTLAIALLNGAAAADEAKAKALVANDVAAYEIFAGNPETPVETDGQTIYLTANQDILTGTDGNDTFIARGNNTLTNADIIDGGKGTDTVFVMLDNKETAESPLLTNVEILKVQVQSIITDSGDNDVDESNLPNNDIESNIDAGDMKSVHTYINDNSRADLTIEDVSRNSHITTLVMRETDMGDVDYNVFFDPQNITAPGTADQGATLLIKLADVLAIAKGGNPVDNFASLSFNVGATTVNVNVSAATSYDDVVTAIQAAISAANIVGLTVVKQSEAPAYFSIDVAGYTAGDFAGNYNPILITNNASGTLVPGTIELSESAADANMVNTMTNVAGSTVPSLTQTNVVFDRVGRDSQGGDFIAGSDSTGTSKSKGIEQFNVSVDRDSKLNSISSTNNTLEVINIKNIKENSDGNGDLTVKSITDVRVIDASTMTGSANITANLTEAVATKYLNEKDTDGTPSSDNSEPSFLNVVDTYFSYDFGSNNDTFTLTVDAENFYNLGNITREDFVIDINGGDGNDKISATITGEDSNWYANSKQFAALVINAEDGNDTITVNGSGDWKINAGSGNDTVYTDNVGVNTEVATWIVNANAGSTNIQNLLATDTDKVFLVDGKLTITFSSATVASANTVMEGLAIDKSNGYEVTVNIPTGDNYTVTTLHINQAIKNAILNDAVLSKLLTVEDTQGQAIVIKSLIDGTFAANDLLISVSTSDLTDTTLYNTSAQASIISAYQKFISNSAATTIAAVKTVNDASVTTLNAAEGMTTHQVLATEGIASLTTLHTATTTQDYVAPVAEIETVQLSGLEDDTADETMLFTITDATGTATFTATLPSNSAIAAATVSPVTYNVTGTSAQTYTVGILNGLITVTAGTPGTAFDVTSAAASGDDLSAAAKVQQQANVLEVVESQTLKLATDGISLAAGSSFVVVIDGVSFVVTNSTANTLAGNALEALVATTLTTNAAIVNGTNYSFTNGAASDDLVIAQTNLANAKDIAPITVTTVTTNTLDGAFSTAETDNKVTGGAGDDVIVLSTSVNSNDTLVFSSSFGKDTVVNFVTGATNGNDMLDFTAYLTTQQSLSGSTVSAKTIAVSLNADANVEANSVTILNDFAENLGVAGTADDETFANLTAEALLNSIKNDTLTTNDHGNLANATLNAVDVASLVGTTYKSIVMIENDKNDGEYKVFELTATDNGDFTAAALVGTIDFGDTLDGFVLANLAGTIA